MDQRYRTERATAAATSSSPRDQLHLILIEDRLAVAEALKLIFEQQAFARVTIARTGEEGVRAASTTSVDVVVVDIGKTEVRAGSFAETLLRKHPDLGLVGVSGSHDEESATELQAAGFRGLVRKEASLAELVDVVMAVARGETVLRRQDLDLVRGSSEPTEAEAHALLLGRQLTLREHEVLTMLTQGASSAEITEGLGIRSNTLRTHVQNIMTKLQVHSRLQAVMFAVRHGLVAVPDQDELPDEG